MEERGRKERTRRRKAWKRACVGKKMAGENGRVGKGSQLGEET